MTRGIEERSKKKIVVIPFCVATKIHKIENCFSFEELKKKNFQRIIENFTLKLSLSSQKYWFGIRDPEKTYFGSRGQKRHRIPDPDP